MMKTLEKMRRGVVACLALAGICVSLSGCATASNVQVEFTTQQRFAPTSAVSTLPSLPHRPYLVIATLRVDGVPGDSSAQLLAMLQAQAAAIGADAIVVSNRSTSSMPMPGYSASGGTFIQPSAKPVPAFSAIAIRYVASSSGAP